MATFSPELLARLQGCKLSLVEYAGSARDYVLSGGWCLHK